MGPLAAIVLCRGLRRRLLERLEMLRRQDIGELLIVLVSAGERDDMSRRVLASAAAATDVVHVEAPAASSGSGLPGSGLPAAALRNAGVEAAVAEAVFFLEPGFDLEPGYCRRALEALAADPALDFVTGPQAAAAGEAAAPSDIGLPALLGHPEAIHPAAVFRRRLWEDLGGFDERLEMSPPAPQGVQSALEMYDFWLRAVERGARGTVLDDARQAGPLVRPLPAAGELGDRSRLRREVRLPALTAVFAKHRPLFEADPAAVLIPRERQLQELSVRRRALHQRRARAVEEVERLNGEIRGLTAELRLHGRDRVEWGDLRRTTPISSEWGTDRGKPIDRRYIEEFLAAHAGDIRGAVLEVQEGDYTRDFGGERVEHSDVVDFNPDNPRATIVADLRRAAAIPPASYDCFILTQTVHVIDDMRAALAECARILKPGGVLLLTFPCLSRVCLEYGDDGDFWRLTEAGARRLVYEVFPPEQVSTRSYGNVMTAAAFLYGLACDELRDEEFDAYDPFHPVLVGVRAVKPGEPAAGVPAAGVPAAGVPATRTPRRPSSGVILAYHRVASCSQDLHGMCVPAAEFRAQMEHLRRHRHLLDLVELATRGSSDDLPPGAVAVTFDDGYADALTAAAPVLSELGIPATFFVATEGLDNGAGERGYWWDRLERIFYGTEELPERLEIRLRGESRRFATVAAGERQAAHRELYRAILRCPPAQRDEALRQLGRWSGIDLRPAGAGRPMSGDEVVRLAAIDGLTIGAHSVHHLALSHQPFETQQREIMESKTALERLLSRPVPAFAYPYGDVCDPAVDLVRAASFRLAVTCEEAAVGPRSDPLRLPRFTVPGRSGSNFGAWLKAAAGGS